MVTVTDKLRSERVDRRKITPTPETDDTVYLLDSARRGIGNHLYHTDESCHIVAKYDDDPTEVDREYAEEWCAGVCSFCDS